jgi:hypothetical protein
LDEEGENDVDSKVANKRKRLRQTVFVSEGGILLYLNSGITSRRKGGWRYTHIEKIRMYALDSQLGHASTERLGKLVQRYLATRVEKAHVLTNRPRVPKELQLLPLPSARTLRDVIRPAMGVIMSKALYGLAQAATSIGLSCDATTVQQYHFMGGVIRFLFKEVLEVDMFGSTQCSTNKIDFALNPMLLGAKYSTVVMRSDGSEFLAESPLAMTRALFYSGGMPMMAEFGGKMGVCLDGAGDNCGTEHSKASMCGNNSPMECMLVKQKMWKVVEDEAKENGLYPHLVQCWNGENPEELTKKCRRLTVESRQQAKALSM